MAQDEQKVQANATKRSDCGDRLSAGAGAGALAPGPLPARHALSRAAIAAAVAASCGDAPRCTVTARSLTTRWITSSSVTPRS